MNKQSGAKQQLSHTRPWSRTSRSSACVARLERVCNRACSDARRAHWDTSHTSFFGGFSCRVPGFRLAPARWASRGPAKASKGSARQRPQQFYRAPSDISLNTVIFVIVSAARRVSTPCLMSGLGSVLAASKSWERAGILDDRMHHLEFCQFGENCWAFQPHAPWPLEVGPRQAPSERICGTKAGERREGVHAIAAAQRARGLAGQAGVQAGCRPGSIRRQAMRKRWGTRQAAAPLIRSAAMHDNSPTARAHLIVPRARQFLCRTRRTQYLARERHPTHALTHSPGPLICLTSSRRRTKLASRRVSPQAARPRLPSRAPRSVHTTLSGALGPGTGSLVAGLRCAVPATSSL